MLFQAGTYSINPLAGYTDNAAACIMCPADASCEGGPAVVFRKGIWSPKGGVFQLVGCPPGSALVNSIDGVFSLDLQRCIVHVNISASFLNFGVLIVARCTPCGSSMYILNSNSSNFGCQLCPAGATCNGQSLVGSVVGSIWAADWSTGIYLLTSCPPGFHLINEADG